jgi:phage FluMu protein Com
MPYLRCPTCGLLAHATENSAVIHCPRCRAAQKQIQLTPVEESLSHLSAAPEQQIEPDL